MFKPKCPLFELPHFEKNALTVSYRHGYDKRETNVVLTTKPTDSKLRLLLIPVIRFLIKKKKIVLFTTNKFRELSDPTTYMYHNNFIINVTTYRIIS